MTVIVDIAQEIVPFSSQLNLVVSCLDGTIANEHFGFTVDENFVFHEHGTVPPP